MKKASVSVDGREVSAIGAGYLVLLGIRKGDSQEAAEALAKKVAALRIMRDSEGKMNRGLADCGGKVLVVSQMTLYGDTKKGNRPSFDEVAPGAEAEPLYGLFVETLKSCGIETATGVFGGMMDVELINDGPVTFMLER